MTDAGVPGGVCSHPQGWARRCTVLKDSVVPSPGFSLGIR